MAPERAALAETTNKERAPEHSHWLPPAPTKLQQTDPSLTDRVRALYEGGVMPVADIARLVGVAERTLYRYVARGGWQRRYEGRGREAAAANRGRKREARAPQPRGAGGRFIPSGERGLPHAVGLKALDPRGAVRAAVACEAASAAAHEAFSRALALHDAFMQAQIFALVVRAMKELSAMLDRLDEPDEDSPRRSAARPAKTVRAKARRRKPWIPGRVSWPTPH